MANDNGDTVGHWRTGAQKALHSARQLKERLLKRDIPVRQVYLFGSAARGTAGEWSDIDIAVVCDPFRLTRMEEGMEIDKVYWDHNLLLETICLHPDDFENPFSIAQEVKEHGIPV